MEVVGRGKTNTNIFFEKSGLRPVSGGLDKFLKNNEAPEEAIVAVNADQLYSCSKLLLEKGCKRILLEKPGSLLLEELKILKELADKNFAEVYIAYNRRFYKSIRTLLEKLKFEGPISSINFEFTEFGYKLKDDQNLNLNLKNKWVLCNSTHVLDTVFSLIGLPANKSWCSFTTSSSQWHPSGMNFNGAGVSQKKIPFSFHSNWDAPGRWGIEICTRKKRFLLRPFEKLYEMKLGEFKYEKVNLYNNSEDQFKPGLLLQCREFFGDNLSELSLCSLEEQIDAFPFYTKIGNY